MIRGIAIVLALIAVASVFDTAIVASVDHAYRHAGGILLGIAVGFLAAIDIRATRESNDWWPAPWKDDVEEIDPAP